MIKSMSQTIHNLLYTYCISRKEKKMEILKQKTKKLKRNCNENHRHEKATSIL